MKNNLDNNSIAIKIDINKNHIDNYVLEIEEGTKRTRDKFYKQAANSRNDYINNQHIIFSKYLVEVKNEIASRLKNNMPVDKSESYNEKQKEVDGLFDCVRLYSSMSNSFKLNLDYIVASINDDIGLDDLISIIKNFINKFKGFGIFLSVDDFKYTMFTEEFMIALFKTEDFNYIKEIFEKIYFNCPDIKLQLKMNLKFILEKYSKQLSEFVESHRSDLSKNYLVHSDNVIEKYAFSRKELGEAIATDEYYNTKLFLDGEKKVTDYLENSPLREKNYNTFAINEDYNALDENDKQYYSSSMMGLYVTLNELKKYYNYEFIIKDLLERYKSKDTIKTQYAAKKKEVEKEENKRLSIYKEYLRASGIGFLAKKSDQKIKDSMLKMNEQIKVINKLSMELDDLEITNNLSNLVSSASIYDLFMSSLTSFSFLEKSFSNNESFNGISLEENINEFLRFLYNPNNSILRKINVFTDYNIVDIVADKYKLLNLNVNSEMVNSENIDSTMETVLFINLIQNIEKSNIDIHKISNLCRMSEIINTNNVEATNLI